MSEKFVERMTEVSLAFENNINIEYIVNIYSALLNGIKPSKIAGYILQLSLRSYHIPQNMRCTEIPNEILQKVDKLILDEVLSSFSYLYREIEIEIEFMESLSIETNNELLIIFQKLQKLKRWTNTPISNTFSVLNHQLVVGCSVWAYYKQQGTRIGMREETTILIGFFHDFLEAFSYDFSRPLKKEFYGNHNVLRNIELEALNELSKYISKLERGPLVLDMLREGEFDDTIYHDGELVLKMDLLSACKEAEFVNNRKCWLEAKVEEMRRICGL